MKQKNNRALKAEETVEILTKGYYHLDGVEINITDSVNAAINGSVSYLPDGFSAVMADAASKIETTRVNTTIKIINCSVLEAASVMTNGDKKIGCLNFASAKNPGGGFLGGAQAQEESLARASGLYPTLTRHSEMYSYNKSRRTYLYSDYMIYSPDIPVFRNDADELIEPYILSVITSPAVNVGAIKTNNPSEMVMVEETMLQRMDKVLALFLHHNIKTFYWAPGAVVFFKIIQLLLPAILPNFY